MLARFALVFLLLASGSASAQFALDWAPQEEANASLPASIRVFRSTTEGIPAWYVRADPADLGWRLTSVLSDDTDGLETVASFAAGAEALVAINGGYFGGGQSYSLVRDGGQTSASNIGALTRGGQTYFPTRGSFGLSDSRVPDVAWVYNVAGIQTAYDAPNANMEGETPEAQPTASFPAGARPWNVSTAIGGGPVLVEDGHVRLTWEEEVFFGGSGVDTTSARARTAIGYDASGHLLLFAAAETRGLRLRELAEIMVSIGAVEAVNLDGGGSTSLIAGGLPLRDATRQVASAVMIVPASGAESIILDTGSAAYSEEGAWFASSNQPYYGDTPARLLPVGEPGRAVYTLDGIPSSLYELEAWWVPSSNRATDTPITVYHNGQPTTFRVDQSDAGTAGQWNYIGLPHLAPGDSIVVAADATPGAGATFVCVDAFRLTLSIADATEPGPSKPLALRASPNPARGNLTVSLRLVEPGSAAVDLIDALGRTVRQRQVSLAAGEARVAIPLGGLPAGVYTVRATASGVVDQARVTVVR